MPSQFGPAFPVRPPARRCAPSVGDALEMFPRQSEVKQYETSICDGPGVTSIDSRTQSEHITKNMKTMKNDGQHVKIEK